MWSRCYSYFLYKYTTFFKHYLYVTLCGQKYNIFHKSLLFSWNAAYYLAEAFPVSVSIVVMSTIQQQQKIGLCWICA
jgi:hypothetical protein